LIEVVDVFVLLGEFVVDFGYVWDDFGVDVVYDYVGVIF